MSSTRESGRTTLAAWRHLGWLLLIPFLASWGFTLLLPTLETFGASMSTRRSFLDTAASPSLESYKQVLSDKSFIAAFNTTVSLATSRVLAVAIIPLLLAIGANLFGRGLRIPMRLLFTLPLVLFAPVSTAIIWRLAFYPQVGLFAQLVGEGGLQNPATAAATLQVADGITAFGLACGIGLVVYGIAMRGAGRLTVGGRTIARPLVVTWLVTVLATAAYALQSFTLSYITTAGGPGRSTTTLALLQFQQSFLNMAFNRGAVISMVILLLVMLLGTITGIIIIASGVRLVTIAPKTPPVVGTNRVLAGGCLLPVLLGSLIIVGIGLLPTIWAGLASFKSNSEVLAIDGGLLPSSPTFAAYNQLSELLDSGTIQTNTIVPALFAVLIYVPCAYTAALAIGGLRPLGRRSEWLLLPFMPWLFVGVTALGATAYQARANAGMLNSLLGLVTPIVCSVPILVILTLFFKGQEERRQVSSSNFWRTMILPSLPLTGLLAAIALLCELHAFEWPLLVASSPEHDPVSVALANLASQDLAGIPVLTAAIVLFGLPVFTIFFVVLATFQIFYVDRLALVTQSQADIAVGE